MDETICDFVCPEMGTGSRTGSMCKLSVLFGRFEAWLWKDVLEL